MLRQRQTEGDWGDDFFSHLGIESDGPSEVLAWVGEDGEKHKAFSARPKTERAEQVERELLEPAKLAFALRRAPRWRVFLMELPDRTLNECIWAAHTFAMGSKKDQEKVVDLLPIAVHLLFLARAFGHGDPERGFGVEIDREIAYRGAVGVSASLCCEALRRKEVFQMLVWPDDPWEPEGTIRINGVRRSQLAHLVHPLVRDFADQLIEHLR